MRVLVFGGAGWVGQALRRALEDAGHDVIAPRSAECDVSLPSDVARTFEAALPEAVVNAAAANTGVADEARLAAVNVEGARNVAAACAWTAARLVHVSTDLVHDGRSPPYRDDAPARPLTPYGRSKAAGEKAVRAAWPSSLIVRASHVYDLAAPDPFLRAFAQRLARGDRCALYVDEVRCPIHRPALASALAELVSTYIGGTLNVAGEEAISRWDYGRLLLDWFRVPGRERVERARAADLPEPRPLDLTLDTALARALLATPLRGVKAVLHAAPPQGRS